MDRIVASVSSRHQREHIQRFQEGSARIAEV